MKVGAGLARWIRHAFAVLLLGAMGAYVVRHQSEWIALSAIPLSSIIGLVFLNAAGVLLMSQVHDRLVRQAGIRMDQAEVFGLGFATAMYDLFLPAKAGVVCRSLYLKRTRRLELREFARLMVLLTGASLVVIGTVGLAALAAYLRSRELAPHWVFGFCAFFALALLAGLVIGRGSSSHGTRWGAHWGALIRLTPALSAVWVVFALRFHVSLAATGIEAAPAGSALASVALIGVTAMNLTPGSLGVREAGFALIAGILGLAPGAGTSMSVVLIQAALLDRLCQLLVVVPWGMAGHWLISGKLRTAEAGAP